MAICRTVRINVAGLVASCKGRESRAPDSALNASASAWTVSRRRVVCCAHAGSRGSRSAKVARGQLAFKQRNRRTCKRNWTV